MKKQVTQRMISLMLVLALLVGIAVPVSAADENDVTISRVDNSAVSATLLQNPVEETTAPQYADTDLVRVSILLESAPTLQAGFGSAGIADNLEAMTYRNGLQNEQAAVAARIEQATGEKLDVVWNLTLAANLISANVEYGRLASIAKVPGVAQVVLETRYDPAEAVSDAEAKPNMLVSAEMTGATQVWETGFTGGGTRIAIIDTGLDTDHRSFDSGAFAHALADNAAQAGMSYEEYLAGIDLLDQDELTQKLSQLHIAQRSPELTAEDLYFGMKAPFGYNYLDMDVDVTHDNDTQGSHGSHVAGISAANRYVKRGSEYVPAADEVAMQGNAPDAQIIVMKVFGKMGGCYESDYMAAIEDAIILDCDAINLSLGSSTAGFASPSGAYEALMERLVETEAVVAMAAGNQGYWAANAAGAIPYLYVEDVNFQTAGSPGTYANALTVASVNNDGSVGSSIKVAGNNIGFSDGDGYWNEPLASLDTTGEGTEYDYVFLNGFGVETDYTGIDVTGKIVFVSRGETNFADKAQIAFDHGAIATIIYNNVLEGINMDLSGYYEEAPCAIITMAKGLLAKENSTATTTEAGVTYYTGKLTVSGKVSANVENSDYYVMSSFSSWGAPGDLTMKPEITAPGGNIYSVKGDVAETDQYELMSGTSMATPQVSGFAALMKQAIAERGLSQEGMTDRALAQSLLMSTALPLKDADGLYYSVLQQGAGMTDILAATAADSYILVDGQADGKVKVELGDDPDRTGEYSFTFRIHNLDNQEKIFALSAEMFTQDVFTYYANLDAANALDESRLALYLDTVTRFMDFTVDFTSDGRMVALTEGTQSYDFDADGDTDTDDAQVLLDYVTGIRQTIEAMENADVSGDGDVDTYDVHVLLTKLRGHAVAVPAGESVEVNVKLSLTEDEKEFLETYYINGAYVQAFVYADAIADAEGVDGTCHSIPVLGFYGNWTDSSMYEIGSVQTHATGDEIRDPYTGNEAVNSLSVEYARDPGYTYYLGGNPVVTDSTYHPERNAFNNRCGDKIYTMQFNVSRNTAATRMTVTNTNTGEILKQDSTGSIYAPYYGVVFFVEMWMGGSFDYRLQWADRDVAEGQTLEFKVEAAPEYNVDDAGNVDWDALGDGATLTIPLTMDSTAPVINAVAIDVINNTLEVGATDNQYVAGVALFDGGGKNVLSHTGSMDEAVPGGTYSYVLDLSNANGNKFLVQVYDYAYNVTTYELRMELGDVPPLPDMIAFDKEYDYYWTAFTADAWYRDLSIYSETDVVFSAATIDSHYVFACSDEGELYVMPETDLSDMIRIRNLGVTLTDMAYNPMDDKLYGVAYNAEGQSVLYTIDKMVGTLTEVGKVGLNINTLACDPAGTFYCNEFSTSKVYTFTLDTLSHPSYLLEVVNDSGETFETMGAQAMEYDPNTHNVVWTSYYYEERSWGNWDYSFLYEIHPANGTYTRHNDLSHQLVALIIPEASTGGDWTDPTDEIESLELSHETMHLLRGNSDRLTVTVLPWNVSDRTVTWTSSDPTVAEVDQYGLVTGLKAGTATITAISNLNPEFKDTVTVTVEALPIELSGIILDEEGNSSLFTWDMPNNTIWTKGVDVDTEAISAAENGKGKMVVAAGDGVTLKAVDMSTGISDMLGTWGTYMYDMAYSRLFSDKETDRYHMISGSFWLPAKDPADPAEEDAWELFDYIFDYSLAFEFVAIATGDIVTVEDGGRTHQAEELYLVDDNGNIWKLHAYADGDFYNSTEPVAYPSSLEQAGYTFTRMSETMLPLCSLVVGEDGHLYFSGYNGKTNVIYQLKFNEATQSYDAVAVADVGEDVWPGVLTQVKSYAGGKKDAPVHTVRTTLSQGAERVRRLSLVHKMPVHILNGTEDVTVSVKTEADSTNGLFTAQYDATLLTLKAVESEAVLTALRTEEGKVTFGYAGEHPIDAGETVATLIFAPATGDTTDVVITTTERNDDHLELTETITVELPDGCNHSNTEVRGAVESTCTEDGYTGDTYCADCGELLAEGEVIPAACPTAGYTDVPVNVWYHEAVDHVVEHGIMEGTGENTFSPNATTTRAQLVTVLYRLAGSPEVELSGQFKDVSADHWYAKAVAWAAESEITTGVSDEYFAPNKTVTREQVVTFLYRYARFMGMDVTAQGDLSRFTDKDNVSAYARDAFNWAVETGVVNGMTETTLVPQGTSIRAQIATILMRFMEMGA